MVTAVEHCLAAAARAGKPAGVNAFTPSVARRYLDGGARFILVGADVAYKNLTLGVAYVDTDLSGAQAARGGATKDIVDSAVVFSLTAAF